MGNALLQATSATALRGTPSGLQQSDSIRHGVVVLNHVAIGVGRGGRGEGGREGGR